MDDLRERVAKSLDKTFGTDMHTEGTWAELCLTGADRILALIDAEYRPGWVSVKERLPTEDENDCPLGVFIVVCRTHGGYNGAYQSVHRAAFYPDMKADPDCPDDKPTEHYWEIDGVDMQIPFEVTHWRPLPEPPREE